MHCHTGLCSVARVLQEDGLRGRGGEGTRELNPVLHTLWQAFITKTEAGLKARPDLAKILLGPDGPPLSLADFIFRGPPRILSQILNQMFKKVWPNFVTKL